MVEITKVKADGVAEKELIASMRRRASEVGAGITRTVEKIMADIRERGYEAVKEYSFKLDGAEPYEVSQEQLKAAYESLSPALITAYERARKNLEDYNRRLVEESKEWESSPGAVVGELVRGLKRVGIYVPGGTAAYPSSVLMNAVPARVAGVEELIMVTPPTENLSPTVLAAAYICGVDRVFAVGGAHAVAALTYGAGPIPRVDKLVGPGNAYVAEAKRMAYGTLDIDMIAGPSEILVIADESANPAHVAADMLSQAEHDALASSVLLTTSDDLANKVLAELDAQLSRLSRTEIMVKSLRDFGMIIVCGDMDTVCELANVVAPEHLEILTKNPREELKRIKNAGAVFLGAYSPEPLGDYMAGANHVLPTSGTARFFSPLSAHSFVKRMSVIEYTREALEPLKDELIMMSRDEKLDAHANSVAVRFGL